MPQRVRLLITDGIPGVMPGRYDVGDEGTVVEELDGSWKNWRVAVLLDRYSEFNFVLHFAPGEYEEVK